jgi:hypothetical protein
MAPVEEIALLTPPVPLHVARKAIRQWGWLRYPRRGTVVPDELVHRLEALLGIRRVSRCVRARSWSKAVA